MKLPALPLPRPAQPASNAIANRWMGQIALGLLIFTLIAFAAKALAEPAVRARYTPLVIAHALAMTAWLGLLSNQAFLAARRGAKAGTAMRWHRALGRASIALVGLMAVTGAIISVNIGRELGRGEVTIVNLAAFVTFIPLYFAALRFAAHKQLHSHRQAMLIGTLALMTPAYARLVQIAGLPDPLAIAVQPPITIAIALGYDWAVLGRLTRATLLMLAFSLAIIAGMVAVLAIWFL